MKKCDVLILSAGHSKRMKTHKAFLTARSKTFLQLIYEQYKKFGCRIIFVFNDEVFKIFKQKSELNLADYQIVINNHKERFISIAKGIEKTETNFVFIQNIDNPSVSAEVLEKLFENRFKGDYIVPYYKERGGHPILINKKVINSIKNFKDTCQNLRTFLQQFKKVHVKVDRKEILENINTYDEYLKFLNKKF